MRKLLFVLFLPILIYAQNVRLIELDEISGDTFFMAENLDHDATVISFWATWCLPCKKEHPALQQMKEDLADYDLQLITISIDSPRSLAKVKSYVKSKGFEFTWLLDPNGEVSQELLVKEVPFTMLVNSKGKVVYTHSGYRKGDEKYLKTEIHKLLKQGN